MAKTSMILTWLLRLKVVIGALKVRSSIAGLSFNTYRKLNAFYRLIK